MLRLGVVSSHGGTNLQAIFDAVDAGRLDAAVVVVVSNNSGSQAIERARRRRVARRHISRATHPEPAQLAKAFIDAFAGADLVVLTGYNQLLPSEVVAAYPVINTHPAPLPRFGGQGMYGLRVHEAVLAAGLQETAATIHLADERYDHGAVLAFHTVPVYATDTPESLAERVKAAEGPLLVSTLRRIAAGEISLQRS